MARIFGYVFIFYVLGRLILEGASVWLALEGAGVISPWDARFGLGAAATAPAVLMVL